MTTVARASNQTIRSDIEQIRQAVQLILAPAWERGDVVELRALNTTKATVSGYFDADNQEELVAAAAEWSGRADGIYITLNPVLRDCLARAANRTALYAKHATGDKEITHRHWLLIDTDPTRPSGISSTDSEHELALERAQQIFDWLHTQNWPDPILSDSGNGGHLLYRIDLPADDGGLVQRVLQAIDRKFGDSKVGIDLKVCNPARISKLYGTMARKGDSIPERPHRIARIIAAPGEVEIVSRELLEAVTAVTASTTANASQSNGHAANSTLDFDVVKYLKAHGVEVGKSKPFGDGGTLWELNHCVWRPTETDGGPFVIQFANGNITAGCQHNKCKGKGWDELRDVIDPGWHKTSNKKSSDKGPSAAQQLVALAADDDLFHTANDEAYATAQIDSHKETWRVNGEAYRLLMRKRFHRQSKIPTNSALDDAIATLEAKALFDRPEHPVYVRTAEHEGKYYIDLCNDGWEVVEIGSDGWKVINDSPVRFVRYPGILPLPNPTRGGSVEQLREFVNVTPQDWPLYVAWIIGALRPTGPYAILNVNGEQGSCKSNACRRARSLVDPNTVPLRDTPKDAQTLMIWAKNSHVIGMDNLSTLSKELSNGMCRLATGGGYSQKTNYTDDSETLFYYVRPQMVNGIGEFATRSDFLDRALSISLPVIPKSERKTEKELDEQFAKVHASIFGAFLTAMSKGLERLPEVEKVKRDLPRLADFATWIIAVEEAVGLRTGAFLAAMNRNQDDANELAISSSLVAETVRKFIMERITWEGTASALLKELNKITDEAIKRSEGWPSNANWVSTKLRERAPNLRAVGIDVDFFDGERPKRISLKYTLKPQAVVETQPINPALAPYASEAIQTCFGNVDYDLCTASATLDTLLRVWTAQSPVAPVAFPSLNMTNGDVWQTLAK